ncbi:MAG: efflux RND transporter periplasmic adaptor subunit [Chloroflexota bacterium]|nr:efflux RND transporter periplasmic adaptor subunit [Chloroflexota bacterium]
MSEVSGRVTIIKADEGELVQAGELLVQLDDELLEAQLAEAEAAVELAKAGLARTKVGLPPEEVHHLEALVQKAKTARDWARVAWQDAAAIRENPQDLEVQLAEARARAQALDYQAQEALAMKDAAKIAKEELARTVTWLRGGFDIQVPIPGGGTASKHIEAPESKIENAQDELNAATTQWWQAWVGVNTATTAEEGAQAALSDLEAIRENPQGLKAQVDEARDQYEQAQAAVEVAEARLALAKAGASEEEIAVAEAKVAQARAAYEALATQRDKLKLHATLSGRVMERMVEEGEMVSPGAPLLTLADLSEVTLTIYIPEADIARVKVGQPVTVTVDSYPDREFKGKVVHIANEAEFIPRNVQTKEERVTMVFAVKVEIPNPDGALKPGMPADAVIEVEGER